MDDELDALFGETAGDLATGSAAAAETAEEGGSGSAAAAAQHADDDDDDDAVVASGARAAATGVRPSSPSNSSTSSSSSSSSSDSGSDSDSDAKEAAGGDNGASPKKRARKLQPKRKRMAARRFKEADAKQQRPAISDANPKGPRKENEDGDEYDSGPEVQKTADDDAFIDREGDDAEMLAEYDAEEQNFGDEPAFARKKPAKKRRRAAGGSDDEAGRSSAAPKSKSKADGGKKKKRRAEMTDAEKQVVVDELIRDMRAAAAQDRVDRKAGRPAVSKLKLLNQVRLAVANASLQELLLEGTAIGSGADYSAANNPTILSCFREWLRPLPGVDMPPLPLREAIYELLGRLPATLHHLRDSRIGEVLFALSQHPSETAANRAALEKLIEKYSRMIFSKQDRYRGGMDAVLDAQAELHQAESSGRAAAAAASSAASSSALPGGIVIPSGADLDALVGDDVEASIRGQHGAVGAMLPQDGDADLGEEQPSSSSSAREGVARGGSSSSSAAPASGRVAAPVPAYDGRHARIPAPVAFDFMRRPVRATEGEAAGSGDGGSSASGAARGSGGGRGGKDVSAQAALTKRIVTKRRESRMEGFTPAVRMSIEGRGTT